MNCTRCRGTGFLNVEQIEDGVDTGDKDAVFAWAKEHPESGVAVCDLCSLCVGEETITVVKTGTERAVAKQQGAT